MDDLRAFRAGLCLVCQGAKKVRGRMVCWPCAKSIGELHDRLLMEAAKVSDL